eukprot:Gb_11149 [translate_table: standard]
MQNQASFKIGYAPSLRHGMDGSMDASHGNRPSGFGRSCQGLVDIITGHGALLLAWQSVVIFSVDHHVENRRLKWFSKGLGGAEHTLSTLWFALVKCGVAFDVLIAMGGDPVITKLVVLSMEEDVGVILDDSGLLPFFKKFSGHNEAITNQFMETWKNDRLIINGMHIDVSEGLIAEVTGLSNDGELVSRDKMDQVSQLTKFIKENETLCWLDSGIARESLPQPWDKVVIQVMKYISLEGKTKSPRHQGLMKLIVEHNSNRLGSPMGLSRGAAIRVSGVPITKSQLLIGPAPPSLLLTSINSESDADEDSESQGSSDEEQKIDTAQGKIGRSNPTKSEATNPSEKGEGSPVDSEPPSEDFLGHLQILNSLSGTLMSSCAYLNLLIVEIINYLKEAAKGKKD